MNPLVLLDCITRASRLRIVPLPLDKDQPPRDVIAVDRQENFTLLTCSDPQGEVGTYHLTREDLSNAIPAANTVRFKTFLLEFYAEVPVNDLSLLDLSATVEALGQRVRGLAKAQPLSEELRGDWCRVANIARELHLFRFASSNAGFDFLRAGGVLKVETLSISGSTSSEYISLKRQSPIGAAERTAFDPRGLSQAIADFAGLIAWEVQQIDTRNKPVPVAIAA